MTTTDSRRYAPPGADAARRVLLLGASGTAGQATARALVQAGHELVCVLRGVPSTGPRPGSAAASLEQAGAVLRRGDVTDPDSLRRDGFRGEHFDVLVSCLASRTGVAADAWAIDYQAQMTALAAAREAGVSHMVLLSAICVQRPRLAFQHAKLAFERELAAAGIRYSIVRPTAFFKSLAGQVDRVRRGKPFLLFGDGTHTACKPISDADLGAYIAGCLHTADRWNRILPIGGPGQAITPRDQGEALFSLTARRPRFRRVPLTVFDTAEWLFGRLAGWSSACADKAELARIGRYYATESMLLYDAAQGRYDADATPSTGHDTLFDFYAGLLDGSQSVERGSHAIFSRRASRAGPPA